VDPLRRPRAPTAISASGGRQRTVNVVWARGGGVGALPRQTVPAQPGLARRADRARVFLARLTGDPTNLYLPLDASLEARAEFDEKHGFNDPLTLQFGRFLEGLALRSGI
jgi:hypothetical protein